MDKYTSIGVKLKDLRGRMCTHIGIIQCHLLIDLVSVWYIDASTYPPYYAKISGQYLN